jgi:recombination associated protein RdgC
MKLSKLRNAIVYRATLPSIEAVEGHLTNCPTLNWVKRNLHGRLSFLTHSPANW